VDKRVADRIRAIAETSTESAAQIHRELQAESLGVSYESTRRLVAQIRGGSARPVDRSPSGMADRILSLLDRELVALERHRGKTDLDRLDKIAATLRRVEPIRPKAEKTRSSSLQHLLPTEEQQNGEGRSEGSEIDA
jgi:hypothetical protein